ncbi:MAG: lipoprotein signal peptidase [Rhodobacter sp. BACL10 MAG-121220-bin24]|nr:MAG: lipoprotein signal peptidase [Rhodobacter sp. BACL10 MAG-121220-bin24]MDO7588924.1 signal peptidase II [Planktomarina temperata]
MRLLTAFAVGAFLLDQVSKVGVLWGLNLAERGAVEVFPPFLRFQMAWNRGINFGLFANHTEFGRFFLIAVAFGVLTAVLWWVRGSKVRPIAKIFAGLLVGGALGNIVDRLIYGAVVDFLNISCCGIGNPYAFNIADAAIFIGALGLALSGPDTGQKPKTPKGNKTP